MNLPFGKKRVSNVGSGEEKGLTMAPDNEWKGMDVRHPSGQQCVQNQPAIETDRHNLPLSDHAESESLKEVVSVREEWALPGQKNLFNNCLGPSLGEMTLFQE